VNLTGWSLTRGVNFTLPNVTLPAGGYLVVAANVPAFSAKYPGVANVVGGWTGRLGNSYESVELEDAQGQRIALVNYADQGEWGVRTEISGWDWTSAADGLGSSLELRQAALDIDAARGAAVQAGLRNNPSASQAIGYRQALEFLSTSQTAEDHQNFLANFKKASRHYSKRQFTWFRKEPLFRWLNLEEHPLDRLKELILQDFEQND
jgi:hypothetical protein